MMRNPTSEAFLQETGFIHDFLLLARPERGFVPARTPYLPHRDPEFAKHVKGEGRLSVVVADVHAGNSHVMQLESAWDGVRTGRRLGYREDDIAAYLKRNYVDIFAGLFKSGQRAPWTTEPYSLTLSEYRTLAQQRIPVDWCSFCHSVDLRSAIDDDRATSGGDIYGQRTSRSRIPQLASRRS